MAVTDTLIGTLFDGRYRILRKLGSGGMANVYLAEDEDLGRRVAIKILNDRYANDEAFTERFRREAKSAAALSHPNIVSIYDRGQAEGRPYIAMEVIEGRSLKELIVNSGPLPIGEAVEYAKQILSALRFAHRHGIIHRDIKPHNILLGNENRLKVTDFGIARYGPSQMTEVGSIMGTAQYLSPEQARGAPVTASSDLYSAGIVLYEMLTGKTPFTGETPIEIAMKHLNEPPRPPSELRPEISPELDQIVLRSLAKDPNERYETADEFSADLDRVEAGLPVSPETTAAATAVLTGMAVTDATQVMAPDARTRVLPPTAAPPGRPPGYPPDYGYRPPKKRRRWVPWLLVLLFAGLAIAAGWYVYSRVQDELQDAKPVAVPPVVGLTEELATEQLERLEFEVAVKRGASTEQPEGTVYDQDPGDGTRLAKGETVTIFVSTGFPQTDVPSVVGLPYAAASQRGPGGGPEGETRAGVLRATRRRGRAPGPEGRRERARGVDRDAPGLQGNGERRRARRPAPGPGERRGRAPRGRLRSLCQRGAQRHGRGGPRLRPDPRSGRAGGEGLDGLDRDLDRTVGGHGPERPRPGPRERRGAAPEPRLRGRRPGRGDRGSDDGEPGRAPGSGRRREGRARQHRDDLGRPLRAALGEEAQGPELRPGPQAVVAKVRVAVLAGGRSSEHDISLASARSVAQGLDRSRYEVREIEISRDGSTWALGEGSQAELPPGAALEAGLPIPSGDRSPELLGGVDVVFPVLHGPFGEDGTVQGLLELADVAYVGAGVTASALSMDKDLFKSVMRDKNVPVVRSLTVRRGDRERVENPFGYPVVVKPARLGSSVGISIVREEGELGPAIDLAFDHDEKILLEEHVSGVEVECGVLGNEEPVASLVGEIVPLASDWYDYEAKYADGGMELVVPARITDEATRRVQELAVASFVAADCEGMARVDFFVRDDGAVLVNELNTIPGFTATSVYAKLFEASGIPYGELLDRLVELALERRDRRRGLRY